MFAAIVGLIGVVVGGLITGLQNALLDRSRTKQASSVAERRIRFVVDAANRNFKTALAQKRWWPQPLPLGDWKDQLQGLDPDFPGEEFEKLENAFNVISILDRMATARQKLRETALSEAKDIPAIEEADASLALDSTSTNALQKRKETVQTALDVLNGRANLRVRRRRRWKWATAAGVTVLILAGIGLGVDARVEHTTAPTSVTAEMLDTSISRTLGVDFVSCDHVGNSQVNWHCTIADVGSGPGCRALQPISTGAMKPAAFEVGSAACPITALDKVRVQVGSDLCWDLAELDNVPDAPKDLPDVVPSQQEAGCL